jgi:PAS domain S-box-containing protein
MLDELGEAVIASDAAHRIVYWNAAAQSLLGWGAQDALGQTDSELLQARTNAGQTAEIIAGLLGKRPWSAEATVRTRDGVIVPARITASALRGVDGAVAGFVAVVTDLRAVREAASRREAMAAMDAVASLARGIAQELNEGVTRIESAIRATLARVPLREPARTELDDALRTVDATAALAVQLSAIGRALVIRPAATDLAGVVRGSQAALALIAGTDIAVTMQLEPAPPDVWVDGAVASQILLNLAANASAAMPEGGRLEIATYPVEIARKAEEPPDIPAGPWVVLELRDTRASVPPSLDRFFEPFSEGVLPPGMGMAAAHGMVMLSGGRLTVQPGVSGGLVFRAYFRPAASVRGPESAA